MSKISAHEPKRINMRFSSQELSGTFLTADSPASPSRHLRCSPGADAPLVAHRLAGAKCRHGWVLTPSNPQTVHRRKPSCCLICPKRGSMIRERCSQRARQSGSCSRRRIAWTSSRCGRISICRPLGSPVQRVRTGQSRRWQRKRSTPAPSLRVWPS